MVNAWNGAKWRGTAKEGRMAEERSSRIGRRWAMGDDVQRISLALTPNTRLSRLGGGYFSIAVDQARGRVGMMGQRQSISVNQSMAELSWEGRR